MVATQDLEFPAVSPTSIVSPRDLYSNEPPMETDLHLRQMLLLISCLDWIWQDRNDFFASGNLSIYFSPKQIKSQNFRGPGFFVVLGTERRSRQSWFVWEEEGKYPNVIIEILSDSTAMVDQGAKKAIYQDTFRTPEYFWFDPNTLEFAGFLLVDGTYEAMTPNQAGQFWSRQLKLHLGIHESKLRFFTEAGVLVPTPEEAAKQAQQQVDRLSEKLRQLRIDPEAL